jgi:mannose-6-phosphate isomerase-like protein (cupin superfamily)
MRYGIDRLAGRVYGSKLSDPKRQIMNPQPINLRNKLTLFSEHWSPKIIAQMNDYHFKLAKVQGEFVWHDHPETDELFLVIQGKLEIFFRDGNVILNEGELYVVPRGVEHKPVAEEECHILLIEPAGTINTGSVVDEKTAPNTVWI